MTGRRVLHGAVVPVVGLPGTAVQLLAGLAISLCGLMGETCTPADDLGVQVAGTGAVATLVTTVVAVQVPVRPSVGARG